MVDGEKVYGAPQQDDIDRSIAASVAEQRERMIRLRAGCYICQPDNPNADPEGCAECDRRAEQAAAAARQVPS